MSFRPEKAEALSAAEGVAEGPKNLANEESRYIGIHFATLRSDLSLSKAKE